MTPEEQAHTLALRSLHPSIEPRRHLSWLRIGGVLLVCGVIAAALVGFQSADRRVPAVTSSSFSPYVDVTATPQFAFEDPTQSAASNVVLGFVVSAPTSACDPTWGAAYTLSSAGATLDLDRRVARLRQRGGQASISFGGAKNSELAIGCTDQTSLTAAYKSVVDRYSATTIDLDIEGDAASAGPVNVRRAGAIADLVRAEQTAGRDLDIWLTLPVGPTGLTTSGQAVLDSMLAAKVPLAGVNALTMDYGIAVPDGQTMAGLAASSLTALQRQIASAYAKTGVALSADAAWNRIGATPMIGQNDTVGERFTLTDASTLLDFARAHHLQRLSMWSLNRDRDCGPNYANVEIVSPNCSGVDQATNAFTADFNAFTRVAPTATGSTSATPATPSPAATGPDDPATSPYQIWNSAAAYPAATKVVWQHNVYQAKWYTLGDVPNAPVSTASATPWTLIGPVLPGDHPAPTPTLPVGTYPAWTATTVYSAGDRVLYNGVGYQAKYWTQGNTPPPPGTSLPPSVNNPWQPLTG